MSRGGVQVVRAPLVRCDECGQLWHGGGVHGALILAGAPSCVHGRAWRTDCVGRPVQPECCAQAAEVAHAG